jgi:hypothetical protein
MCGTVMRGADALPGSKATSRAKGLHLFQAFLLKVVVHQTHVDQLLREQNEGKQKNRRTHGVVGDMEVIWGCQRK